MLRLMVWLIPFVPIIGMAAFAACLCCGAAIAAGGFIGSPRARAPVCAGCGHGIAASAESLAAPCPECGSDLGERRAIRYFELRRRPFRIVAGLAVAAFSFIVIVGVRLTMMLVTAPPGVGAATPAASLAAIIKRAGPEDVDQPRLAAEEAARRLAAGSLGVEDRRAIVQAILDRPAPSPEFYVSVEQDELVRSAHADGLITHEALIMYLRARSGEPRIDIPARVRVPSRRFLALESTNASQLLVERRLKEAMFVPAGDVGQNPLPIPIVNHQDEPLAIVPPGSHAFLRLPANPATGTLTLTIEESYRLPSVPPAPPSVTTIAVADRVVRRPLRFEAMDAPTWIALASPADRREEVRRACRIRAVAIDDDASGTERVVRVDADLGSVEGLTLAFDIVVVVGDQEVVAARRVMHRLDGTTRSAMSWPGKPTLPASTVPLPNRVSVRFRPNPALAEDIPGVTAVWGETITLDGVQLESSTASRTASKPAPTSGAEP
jgi:hypothetical protein